MKKIVYLVWLNLLMLFIVGCNSDDGETTIIQEEIEEVIMPQLITLEPIDITDKSAKLGGSIIDNGSEEIIERGVCWSFNANPTTTDNCMQSDGSGLGDFFVFVSMAFQPNTTYNTRAYAINSAGVTYGDNITFTTTETPEPDPVIVAFDPEAIVTNKATLKATVYDVMSGTVTNRGFAIDTNQNPTVGNTTVSGGSGLGTYTVTAEDLNPNTVYYARPYVYIAGHLHYGEQVSFRTVGYFGPAGKYVVYDKGKFTDGWRYMEAYPLNVDREWGCFGTQIPLTSPEIGKGKENTQRIVAGCSSSNCAARLCNNLTYNDYADWFLGSTEELKIAFNSLIDVNGILDPNDAWTSTQFDSSHAYHVSGGDFVGFEYKSFSFQVIALRTY